MNTKHTALQTLAALAVAFEAKANECCGEAIVLAMQAARLEALSEIVEEEQAAQLLSRFEAEGIIAFATSDKLEPVTKTKAKTVDAALEAIVPNSKGGKA